MVIQGINALLDVWLHVMLQIFVGVTQFSVCVWGETVRVIVSEHTGWKGHILTM